MFSHRLVGLAGNLGLPLPVPGVDGLDKLAKGWETGRFLVVHHFIFDVPGEALVCLLKKGGITPLEMRCEAVKLNEIKGRLGTLGHTQPFYLSLCLSYRVERPEVGGQFVLEQGPVG